MNLFYKSIIFSVTFFCLTLNSSAKVSGYYEKEEIKQKEVIIEVGVKQSIPIDYRNEFKIIYDEFCQSHRVSIDGDVVESNSSIFGEALGTDNDSYAYFCKFVTSMPITKTMQLKERCSECKGSGIKYVYPGEEGYENLVSSGYSNSKPSILQPIKTDCRACNHTGVIDISVNFKIICKNNIVPKMPKTLRQREQVKIEELVAKGDQEARIKYATQHIDGTPIITKDLKKAKSILEELLVEGYVPALEQYLRVLDQDTIGNNSSIDIKNVFYKSSQILGGGIKAGPALSGNYIKNTIEDILAKNIVFQLRSKTLKPAAFNASTLINDFKTSKNIGQFSDIENVLIPWIESNNHSRIDEKTLLGVKKLAQNLQPSAFYVLGTISENGMCGSVNRKAAYLFYACAEKISNSPNTILKSVGFSDLESFTPTQEIITELSEFKLKGKCTPTFIDAIYNIN